MQLDKELAIEKSVYEDMERKRKSIGWLFQGMDEASVVLSGANVSIPTILGNLV